MVSDWGPSHKSSCSLYSNRTCTKLSSSSYPHKPTTILRPLTRVKTNHLTQKPRSEPRATLPCLRCPINSVWTGSCTSRISSSSPSLQTRPPSTSFPLSWTSSGFLLTKKKNLTCPLSFHFLSPPLFFPLHVVIRMAVKANVTVSFPHSKFLSCLYIQFRIIFKSEHFEMKRTCVWTLVCHLCGLSGYLISLSLFLVSDLGIIPTYLIALSWGLNEILFMMRLAQCLVHSKCPHCSMSLRSLQVSFYVTSKRHLLIMQKTVHPP